jgi:hypothetical protein
MCLIKCAFVGERNVNNIKMHGTTTTTKYFVLHIILFVGMNAADSCQAYVNAHFVVILICTNSRLKVR